MGSSQKQRHRGTVLSAGKEVAGCTTDLPDVSETREGLGASLEVELLPELCSFWRRKWQPMPAFLPGESHGQKSLAGHSPQDHKESDTTEATEHICMLQDNTGSITFFELMMN